MTNDQREKILEGFRNDKRPVEWLIWTDGSGHTDGYGGYGAIAARVKSRAGIHPGPLRASAAIHGTTVNRAEFTGLLEALQMIHSSEMKARGGGSSMYPSVPVRVRWFSDRENLVLGVGLDPATGDPYYARHVDQDLWARYDWYAKSILVYPVYVARNTLAFQARCDYVASFGRKAYISWIKHITKKNKWIPPSSTSPTAI